MQGIAAKQLQALQTELEQTKEKLEAENMDGVSGHDLTGNILQTGMLSYFAMTYAQDKLAAKMADSVSYRQPSYGTFGIAGSVSYWFGFPINIAFTGVVMDIDNLAFSSEVKNNCHGDWLALNKASGLRASAYEHIIPEMMFNTDPANPVEGISAVKALSVAAQQNQKIYTLNLDKIEELANINIDSAAKNEIRNALYQGKTVTVHEKPITHFGWTGSGYIVTDNDTGAGAYKISGGSNGGYLLIAIAIGLFLLGLFISSSIISVMLLVASLLVAGCGLSMLFNDSIYVNIYQIIAVQIVAATLLYLSFGSIIVWLIPTLIEVSLLFSSFSRRCAAGF
ncbi:hypothetical protein CXF72_05105 [Psychromonas sp. MB-3u-54]|nr:hypothetical protein CXF72_05105 [Psychromonas sp. MB-3u-54]